MCVEHSTQRRSEMRIVTMTTVLILAGGVVSAKPPLRDVPEIDGALFHVALANEIRKECPDISGRLVKGVRYLHSLNAKARALGYSADEIDAYRNSDAEKARMRAKGDVWLSERNVNKGNPADWCRVGREEISKGSLIGGLLRED